MQRKLKLIMLISISLVIIFASLINLISFSENTFLSPSPLSAPVPSSVGSCPGYAEIFNDKSKNLPINSEKIELSFSKDAITRQRVFQLTKELYNLSSSKTKSNNAKALETKAIERKQEMLKLAEENPAQFLSLSISNVRQKTLPKSIDSYLEKQISKEGYLEILEKPHIDPEGKNLPVEGDAFEYFLKSGDKKYTLKFADGSQPPVSGGAIIKVNGVALDNYLVTSSARTKAFTITKSVDTAKNLGVQRIAIIITKAPGEPNLLLPFLQQNMQKTNEYYKEISYNQVNLEWDVYGPYETDSDDPREIIKTTDQFIDFTDYNRIIIIRRSISCNPLLGGCGIVGRSSYETEDGQVSFSISWLNSNNFLLPNLWMVIAHELGHNFGTYHANLLDCNGKSIDKLSNCNSLEYRDIFDIMGGESSEGLIANVIQVLLGYGSHMNAPHKETVGWIVDTGVYDRINTITNNGQYELYPLERFANKGAMVLKIPKKIDENNIPHDFYYLEYRRPIGFDEQVVKLTQQNNGPQLRLIGYMPGGGGGGDTHLIDMTPENYPYNDGIAPGQTFADPLTNVKIKTISADSQKAVVDITLSDKKCIRRQPTLRIIPSSVSGHNGETFFYNFELINNDESICSDRQIYFNSNNIDPPYISLNREDNGYLSDSKEYPTTFSSGEIIRGRISLGSLYVYNPPSPTYSLPIEIVDVNTGVIALKHLNFRISNIDYSSLNLKNEIAERFFYDWWYGNGYYILKNTGRIDRRGYTPFTSTNGPYNLNNTNLMGLYPPKKIVSGIWQPLLWSDSIISIDNFGNLYETGEHSRIFTMSEISKISPVFSCDIVRDIKIQRSWKTFSPLMLDAYGTVYNRKDNVINPFSDCRTWDGKTDVYRPGQKHAIMFETWKAILNPDNPEWEYETTGYYILSKDGTIYACGDAKVEYTKLNRKLPRGFGSGSRYAVSFALDQEKGIVMLDSLGGIYTSGLIYYYGQPIIGRNNFAKDIKFIPKPVWIENISNWKMEYSGYGILTDKGKIYECKSDSNNRCVLREGY